MRSASAGSSPPAATPCGAQTTFHQFDSDPTSGARSLTNHSFTAGRASHVPASIGHRYSDGGGPHGSARVAVAPVGRLRIRVTFVPFAPTGAAQLIQFVGAIWESASRRRSAVGNSVPALLAAKPVAVNRRTPRRGHDLCRRYRQSHGTLPPVTAPCHHVQGHGRRRVRAG
jgi:hypothetical protein